MPGLRYDHAPGPTAVVGIQPHGEVPIEKAALKGTHMSLVAQYLSELVVFAICAMLVPAGQKETFVYPHEDMNQCFKLMQTDTGFDVLKIVNGKAEPAGSIKVDKDKPNFVVTLGKRVEKVDLSEVQKVLRPFDKAPEQRFVLNGVMVKVGGKGTTRFVRTQSEGIFKDPRPILLVPEGPESAAATTNPSAATTRSSAATTRPAPPTPGTGRTAPLG